MSQYFPRTLEIPPDNVLIGPEFDLMKRKPIQDFFVGYKQVRKDFVKLNFPLNKFLSNFHRKSLTSRQMIDLYRHVATPLRIF